MYEPHITITIHPGILSTIARQTVLSTAGVARFSDDLLDNVDRIIRSRTTRSIKIIYENGAVKVDLFIIVKNDANLRRIGENLQAEIANAIHKMVGLATAEVNVHIEDVELPLSGSSEYLLGA